MEAGPVLLGVGATKAGTSWLYRALADHPACALRAVKEAHYWDSFGAEAQASQVAAFRRRLADLSGQAVGAEGRRAASLARQVADLTTLIAVIEGDRTGDAAYRAFVLGDGGPRLRADITPAYATLPFDLMARMAACLPGSQVLYLVRDPVARLWSHVRMLAERAGGEAPFEARAARLMRGLLRQGRHRDVLERGDYPAAAARLARAVPGDRLRIAYCEATWTEAGWAALQDWLGLPRHPAPARPVHEGPKAALPRTLAREALALLKDHYDWAARALGPLPEAWRRTMETA